MEIARLRNLGVVAHIDAGKTTVSERILYFAGVEHRFGQVDEGTAVLDWMAEERERGITITAAATRIPWRDCAINLIDTPGHVDFTVEVERCMRVLDGAVLVIDAVAGVQAQSETVWRQMRRHRVPCVAFVNKCDRAGADLLAAVGSLRERLGAPAIPVQYPIYEEGTLTGTVDLVSGRAWRYDPEGREAPAAGDPPAELQDEIGVLRSELLDALAEGDEEILQAVLEDREPASPALHRALRARTIEQSLVPVLCGAALRNVGVQPILDAVVDWLPSPLDLPPVQGTHPKTSDVLERRPDPEAPPAALAFKLQADAHGDLTFLRVYSGRLAAGARLLNPRTGRKERAGRLLRMHADSRRQLDEVGPGEIVAVTGLKTVATGDTLCDPDEPIALEPLGFPEPVITMVVEPASTADRDRLRQALARLEREDPTLAVSEDEETGQWAVSGMGELHLEVVFHRLQAEFGVGTRMGRPRVAYREAPRTAGRGVGRVDRVLGGKEVFGAVEIELAPLEGGGAGEGVRVEWADGGAVPEAFRGAVEEALEAGAQVGPRFGYPLTGSRIRVLGGESNPRRDAEQAFGQAAATALKAAMARADVALLEPLMSFEIQAPEEFASGILADLNSRRADVGDVRVQAGQRLVSGTVPLARMFGYSTAVRSLSQGRASFSMQPAGFREVPPDELEARGLVWS